MRIAIVGGGPAGLYFALLAARSARGHEVTVLERAEKGASPGWGVVFDHLQDDLDAHDAPSGRAIRDGAFTWRGHVIDIDGRPAFTLPNDGQSIRRSVLIDILAQRALDLGVDVRHGVCVDDPDQLAGYDLVVAADGVNSAVRAHREAEFGTRVDRGSNRFAWLGTTRMFESFVFPFAATPHGWVWAHAYGFDNGTSGVVVEMEQRTWEGLGLHRLGAQESLRLLEGLFARQLDGHPLQAPAGTTDALVWKNFPRVTNDRLHAGNVALVGDAAHTTHFSIGSGTRLAMQDAMVLADVLDEIGELAPALAEYTRRRAPQLAPTQNEALNSALWFEDVDRYVGLSDEHFATMFDRRRTSLHRRMPLALYLGLSRSAAAVPGAPAMATRALVRLRGARARVRAAVRPDLRTPARPVAAPARAPRGQERLAPHR